MGTKQEEKAMVSDSRNEERGKVFLCWAIAHLLDEEKCDGAVATEERKK